MKRTLVFGLFAAFILSACTPAVAPTSVPATSVALLPIDTPVPTATLPPSDTPTPTRSIPTTGQIWFTPMMYGQSAPSWQKGYGAFDYLDLFREDAPWANASSRVHIFKFYVGTLDTLSDVQLRQIVNYLNRHSIAIALEAPPLTFTAECGQDIEGFAGNAPRLTLRLAGRIRAAGGKLRFIAMDEPLTFGSANPPDGCGMSVEQVAQKVADYIMAVKRVLPDVIIGDIEYDGASVEKVKHLLEAYRDAAGEYLPFLHWDVDWRQRINWTEQARELEAYCQQRGIKFGMIYNGNIDASSDAEWLEQAEDHMAMYESLGGKPDHIIFQSWHMYPKHLLPESDPTSFTYLINRYFDTRTKLILKVEFSSSPRTVIGKLTDISDMPIGGAPIELRVKPLRGIGVLTEYTITGTVPNNATEAIVGFRVNAECGGCNGKSEFNLYEVRYHEGNESTQRVPNGNFSQGLQGWGFLTSNTVRAQANDSGSGLMLRVQAEPGEKATINSAKFPVTAKATYTLTFIARVAPVSGKDSGYFAIFFLSGSSELERKIIPIEPAFVTYNAVTSDNGEFRLALSETQQVPLMIQGKFSGDSTHWPAYSRVTIP